MVINLINYLGNHSPLLYLTQSLWRDEAFSVLISEHSFLKIISLTTQDFNPPLYYLILHFWMKIFGEGEIAIRMLSFIFHLLLVLVVYKFAKALKFSKLITYYLLLITFLNPMLIYFAFEARMYSLLALLATASFYFFWTKNWLPYILTSALGLWTQPFMAFVLVSQAVFLLIKKTLKKEYIVSFSAIFLLFSPWLPVILFQFSRSGPMWIWPINLTTLKTILGNLFTGYEGTPGGLWNQMALLSLVILLLSLLVVKRTPRLKERTLTEFNQLILVWLFLPVVLVLIISYFKPIYVNRYIIFATVAEIFTVVLGISLITNKFIRNLFSICFLLFTILFNIWFPPLHRKSDIRQTLSEIANLSRPQDLVVSQTPLTFFEATYYFPDRSRVYLYNPNQTTVPFYVGASLITKDKMIYNFPKSPKRAFLIHDNATYESISQK